MELHKPPLDLKYSNICFIRVKYIIKYTIYFIGANLALKTQMLIFIILVGISVVFAVISLSTTNPIIIFIFGVLSLILSVVAFYAKYYTYLYIPAAKMKNKTIVLNEKEMFILSPSGNSIVARDEGVTYATTFIKVPLYRSSTEMTDPEKLDFGRTFSRAITISKNTTKISSEMLVVNKDEYITKLRSKLDDTSQLLREAESNEKQNTVTINRLKGELTMWQNIISNISSSRSQALVTYYTVSAFGANEEEAISIVHQRAEELATGISATLGVPAYIPEGDELLSLLEPNYMIPVETVNEIIRQKSIKEGI